MLAEERRNRLLELVRHKGFAALPDLAGELQVSESTIRRDLEHLEETGAAKRTHGGVFYTGSSPTLPHFEERQPGQWDKKRAIARCVEKLIADGDTLLLDGGTTTYELARLLVGRHLQVVTNSLPVATLFASNITTDLVLIGGYVYPRTGVSLGPHANKMLASLSVRRTVLSVAGINERGFYNSNVLLVETEQAMLKAADEVIVVADSSKFGHQSLAHLCPWDAVSCLVVDDGLSPEWRRKIEKTKVRLIIADPLDGMASGSGANERGAKPV
jgi:DeoR family transcriptional regulator, fructose operon transcriptional repressor